MDRILEETGSNQFPNYEPLLKKDELINAMNEGEIVLWILLIVPLTSMILCIFQY